MKSTIQFFIESKKKFRDMTIKSHYLVSIKRSYNFQYEVMKMRLKIDFNLKNKLKVCVRNQHFNIKAWGLFHIVPVFIFILFMKNKLLNNLFTV